MAQAMQQITRELTPEEIAKAVRREKIIKGGKTLLMIVIAVGAGALAYKLVEDHFGQPAEVPCITPSDSDDAAASLGLCRSTDVMF